MKSNPNEEFYIDDEKSPSIPQKGNFKPKKSKFSTIGLIAIAVILAVVIAIILNQ